MWRYRGILIITGIGAACLWLDARLFAPFALFIVVVEIEQAKAMIRVLNVSTETKIIAIGTALGLPLEAYQAEYDLEQRRWSPEMRRNFQSDRDMTE